MRFKSWFNGSATLALFLGLFVLGPHAEAAEKKCLIVAAYHDGFIGQQLKVNAAKEGLQGHCIIRQFDMDTKRNPDPEFARAKALEAKKVIETWKPDVVIGLEDNTAKYLIQPYFKDAPTPIIFAGVDWTAESYGFPYENVTGIIEAAPIPQLLKQVQTIVPDAKKALFIRPDRLSAVKNYERYAKVFQTENIVLEDAVVRTMAELEANLIASKSFDFIFFTNNAAIVGWSDDKARALMKKHAGPLSLSQSEWMAPFVMLTITKDTSEQGDYAADLAVQILQGAQPSDFPIIVNRRWNVIVNEALLERAALQIPGSLMRKAQKVEQAAID